MIFEFFKKCSCLFAYTHMLCYINWDLAPECCAFVGWYASIFLIWIKVCVKWLNMFPWRMWRESVCACERLRERECVCERLRERVCERLRERECVCVWEIERESVCVCERLRERVCVCACACVRERECVCERERESVCVCVCVCVCERESVCVCERLRECVCVWERVCPCVFLSLSLSVCVWERERDGVCGSVWVFWEFIGGFISSVARVLLYGPPVIWAGSWPVGCVIVWILRMSRSSSGSHKHWILYKYRES